MNYFPGPRSLLSLIVLLGVLVMGMRAADMYDLLQSGRLSLHTAQAEESKPTAPGEAAAAKPAADKPVADKPSVDKAEPDSKEAVKAPPDTQVEPAMTSPPPDADASPAELDVLKQLSDRREQLEKRARDLDAREQLIQVTEQRVDQKIKEMQTLRVQLQGMVTQASEGQQAQIDNLVKIYETMKPDDAAKILEKLDMPVLLGVIQKMKPKSTAPIMAKMQTEKAKEITDALTKQDQLPQIK